MGGFAESLSPDARSAVLALAGLTIAFALKHYVADFLLQTNWMARGKEQVRAWTRALVAHVLCHALLTLAIILLVAPRLWWLALADFAIHFVIDRGKARISIKARWQPNQPHFWWLLGFDQLLHQLTNIGMALALVLL